jgi:hypothetical protein
MSNQTASIVPRRRRDDIPPPAPLDPYVLVFLRWLESRDRPPNVTTLARHAAAGLDWPLPFAEAIVVAARTRRLLTVVETNARGGYFIGLSNRANDWLERDARTAVSGHDS